MTGKINLITFLKIKIQKIKIIKIRNILIIFIKIDSKIKKSGRDNETINSKFLKGIKKAKNKPERAINEIKIFKALRILYETNL